MHDDYSIKPTKCFPIINLYTHSLVDFCPSLNSFSLPLPHFVTFPSNFVSPVFPLHHASMKLNQQTLSPLLLRYFTFCLFLSLPLLLLFSLQTTPKPTTTTTTSTEKIIVNNTGIRIRPGYASYEAYIKKQLNKTLNPKLHQLWKTRDWDRKIRVFSTFFSNLIADSLLSNHSKSLCIGARVGQEVEALRRIGVADSIGIDLVPCPPLVIHGDFHNQPFPNDTFDFEFSNVFDHALYPEKFVAEIQRTLKPGGICVLHVALSTRSDKYSANDLLGVDALVRLFDWSDLVRIKKVDGFGLDTEVIFRKKGQIE